MVYRGLSGLDTGDLPTGRPTQPAATAHHSRSLYLRIDRQRVDWNDWGYLGTAVIAEFAVRDLDTTWLSVSWPNTAHYGDCCSDGGYLSLSYATGRFNATGHPKWFLETWV